MTPIEQDPRQGLNGAVAARLRAEKAARGLTNEAVADLAQVPVVSVRRYMAGDRPINMATLHELATALGVSTERLVADAIHQMSLESKVVEGRFPPEVPAMPDDVAAYDEQYPSGYDMQVAQQDADAEASDPPHDDH